MVRVPLIGDLAKVNGEGLEGLEHNFITARIENLSLIHISEPTRPY